MTICIATSTYYPAPGGIPNFCKWLAENLIAEGHRVVVLTIDHSGNNAADEVIREEHYTIIRLKRFYLEYKNHYQTFFRPGGFASHEWIAAGMAMKDWLFKHHKDFRIDIIETNDYGGLGIFLIDDQLPPVFINGHSSITQLTTYNYTQDDDHSRVLQELERLSFQQADAILAHSPMNQASLHDLTGKEIRFARAPWTFPASPIGTKEKTPGKNIVVSGLQMTKGGTLMAEATKIIAEQKPSWEVDWIGGDTYTAPLGQKMSAYLGQQYSQNWNKNFIWQPELPHEKVLSAIAAAGLMIIPSVWDTFNYSALEAVWYERPLIITEQTGASYLFKNDKNVITVCATAQAIADTILDEDSLEEWKRSIDKSSKENLLHYFSVAAIVNERMHIYKEVIANRKKHGELPTESMRFLNSYTTSVRKFYYTTRKWAKRIVKGE